MKEDKNALTLKQIQHSFCETFCEKNRDCKYCLISRPAFSRIKFSEYLEVKRYGTK